MMNRKKYFAGLPLLLPALLLFNNAAAQNGSFSATITPDAIGYKPITINFTKPVYKFDDSHGYWAINPHNGDRHFNLMPPPGYGNTDAVFIDVNNKASDFDIYTLTSDDSDNVTLKNSAYAITAPAWHSRDGDKNKPLHFHITTFTASEIAFTVSGTVAVFSEKGNGSDLGLGTIEGSGHFYRQPQYSKSDVLPGCNCDPTIYATVYDVENNMRSTSDCENALRNKVFNAIQKTFAPVLANVGYHGTGKMSPGEITITMLAGHTNIDVPARDPDYCNTANQHHVTGFAAEKKYYNNEDGYGIRLIKMPTDAQLGIGSPSASIDYAKKIAAVAAKSDSLMKLYMAKKITMEQYQQQANALSASVNTPPQQNTDDFERAKVETDLSIQVFLNPDNLEMMLMKVSDKNKTVIQHNIKGSAFEIFSPTIKDNDGTWLLNKKFLYFGKFTAPVAGQSGGGFDAKVTKAIYPVNGNKLGIYNIIIRLEGSADMIDKAIANMNFDALQSLITKQP